jgi:glycosyltransferase involved in cell wall biosynthesis
MTMQPRILALFGSAVLFGQERGNIEALAALKEQGYEVLCLVRDEQWSTLITPALDERGLVWVKVPYIEHRMPGRLRYVVFRNPVAFIRANWRFMGVVDEFRPTHIHAFNPLYVLNFLLGLTLVQVPMIYRAGDEPTVHNWVWRWLWRFVTWRTKHFVANSKFVASSLCRHGADDDSVSLIYNAPPRHITLAATPQALMNSGEEFRIAYVGQIAEHKGVHILIDAFRALASEFPEAQLTIAGRISDWSGDAWGRNLRDVTSSDPVIGSRVAFVGEIADVPVLLARASVHATPSLFQDPSPNVVMEAKQAGCPSIVFPRGGMPELVEDGVDGFVCPEPTAEALADALRHYLVDAGLARSHRVAALASLNRLGVNQFSDRWLEVYFNSLPPLAFPAEN